MVGLAARPTPAAVVAGQTGAASAGGQQGRPADSGGGQAQAGQDLPAVEHAIGHRVTPS